MPFAIPCLPRFDPDLTVYGPPGTKRLFRTMFRTFPNWSDPPFRVTLKEVKDQVLLQLEKPRSRHYR